MFRRKEDTITPDPWYPANLKELGFFVNKLGHIRMIEAPEKPFVFHSLNDQRHNEVRNEALHACSRAQVIERLFKLGIKPLYFPQLTTTKPNEPHIPVLAPPLDILKTRKRVVVIVNDPLQDLGVLAYRQLQRELGLNGGSVVNFAKELLKRSVLTSNVKSPETIAHIFDDGTGVRDDTEIPGLIVMNTGQLLYSHKYNRTMTMRSWYALPRKSIAHDHVRIHEQENYVEGHRNPTEHIKSVFDKLLCDSDRLAPDAELYIIAIEGGADNILEVFREDFGKYGSRVTAMAVIHSSVDNLEITNTSLKAFLHERTRQWKYTDLSSNPAQCTNLPDDYSCDTSDHDASKDIKVVRWNEELSRPGLLSGITTTLHHLALNTVPSTIDDTLASTKSDTNTSSTWTSESVLCPTFAGGKETAGECVFTEPAIQNAVLSFFEEVAQQPETYRNPAFTTLADVPYPTADAPLFLSADPTVPESAGVQPTSHAVCPEQMELDEARANLADLRMALDACHEDVDILAKGRKRLAQKILNQETAIKGLQVKALGSGSLEASEAEGLRQEWSPKVDGPQVPFAGTMVDSELLKAAGLGDTASEELEKDGEEKAFV